MRLSLVTAVIAASLALSACASNDGGTESHDQALTNVGRVKDIRTLKGAVTPSSRPRAFVELGDATYFLADREGSVSLAMTDGTPNGTQEVASLGVRDFGAGSLTLHAGRLFAVAQRGLWVSDGTALGTTRVPDVDVSSPVRSAPFGAVFAGRHGAKPFGLYVTDGTEAGTLRLGNAPELPGQLVTSGGRVLVLGAAPVVTDGTVAGTKAAGTGPALLAAPLPGGAFLLVRDQASVVQVLGAGGVVSSIPLPAPAGTRPPEIHTAVAFGDQVLLAGEVVKSSNLDTDDVLWLSDGTVEGTTVLATSPRDRVLRAYGDDRTQAVIVGDQAYVRVQSTLWETDGTPAGTRLFPLPAGHMTFHGLAVRDGTIATISRHGSNSAATGLMLIDAVTGATEHVTSAGALPHVSSAPVQLAATANGFLYAGGTFDDHELCASNGTPAGTRHVVDFENTGEASSSPRGFFDGAFGVAGEKLYFTADDGVHGRELWVTDGTEVGTSLVVDLEQGPRSIDVPYRASATATLGDRFLFETRTSQPGAYASGLTLYVTDGTKDGTHALATELEPAKNRISTDVPGVFTSGSYAYFVTEDAGGKQILHRTDGADVEPLLELREARRSRSSSRILPLGGGVVVWNQILDSLDRPSVTEAWITDATGVLSPLSLEGATLVAHERDVAYFRKPSVDGPILVRVQVGAPLASALSPGVDEATCVGLASGSLVFVDRASGDLRLSDGAETITLQAGIRKPGQAYCRPTSSITSSGAAVLFESSGVIVTNGFRAHTFDVAAKEPRNGVDVPGRGFFFNDGNQDLLFWNGSGVSKIASNTVTRMSIPGAVLYIGREANDEPGFLRRLYRTDGTQAGTREILPGMQDRAHLSVFRDRLVFQGVDPTGDAELWSGKY